MKTKIIIVLLLLGCSFSVPANQTFTVGTPTFDPPYVYSENEGFVFELTREICKRLQVTCTMVSMNYDSLFNALNSGKIDWIAGGIFIKPSANYIFSMPYTTGHSQFMILKTSAAQQIADLSGTAIGVVKDNPNGTLFADYLSITYPGQFQITEFNSINNLIMALNNKMISAAFVRASIVSYWEENSNSFKSLGPVYQVGVGIGFMSTPAHSQIIQKINTVLEQMESDNSYLNIYKNYFN